MWLTTARGRRLLGYATNVHAAESVDDICRILADDVATVRARFCGEEPLGLELRLGENALQQISDMAGDSGISHSPLLRRLAAVLRANRLFVFSLNGFPLRDFHQPVVKDAVYKPDWREAERERATIALAHILAYLLPPATAGTISTSPGSFKPWGDRRSLRAEIARSMATVVAELRRIEAGSSRRIILAVEPEPFCTFETTQEFIDFASDEMRSHALDVLTAEHGLSEAEALRAIGRHFGICLDASHLAVEFEDPVKAVKRLREARIPIAKLHVSAAARVRHPDANAAGLETLRRLDEPRYLHQTLACDRSGRVVFRAPDLDEFFALPPSRLAAIGEVRTHFHLPLFAAAAGGLETTADITAILLREVLETGAETQCVVETYTWSVLAGRWPQGGDVSPLEGLARELSWTKERMAKQ